jgi:D-serine deaminase-like pyridoxal phosphate-dependent protein
MRSRSARVDNGGPILNYDRFLGLPVSEVPTPALVIDIAALKHNLVTMRDACAEQKRSWRPHGKSHKSPAIARLQLSYGAGGICAAKLGEAEVFVQAGVNDVLITAPVIGRHKIERLLALHASTPELKFVADSVVNVREVGSMAASHGRKLKVLIDVNVGQNRTGVDTPEDAVTLAREIGNQPALELDGIQAYAGTNQHIVGYDRRRDSEFEAIARAIRVRDALRSEGFSLETLSVGGTGTYKADLHAEGVTEIQPGSFIFMDSHYRSIGNEVGAVYSDFGQALTVMTTIISRPSRSRAITDGGNKALPTDEGLATTIGLSGAEYRPGGDEYGILEVRQANHRLAVGDKVSFVPGHCDTTVNLFDRFFVGLDGVVEAIWPIAARGHSE